MFVTFEGPEGSGKSTAIRSVAERLLAQGYAVLTTREPGAGTFGAKIRQILLNEEAMPQWSELFLFLADRANHVETIIRPALRRGEIVLCDRHADSTVVYQGYARGLDIDQLRKLNDLATNGLRPDLTLLLDLPAEAGLARVTGPDRLDREPLAFHHAVRDGFLQEAKREPDRWRVIDATATAETVADDCFHAIEARL